MLPVSAKDRIVFWCSCAIYGVFALGLAVAFARKGRGGYLSRQAAYTVYMPKWDLYTTSPEGRVDIYKVEGNHLQLTDIRPFCSRYSYGLNRMPKVIAQETAAIAKDTAIVAAARHYQVIIPVQADLNKYINPDTLVYTPVSKAEVTQLRGKYLIVMHMPLTWQTIRRHPDTTVLRDIIAVNVQGR